MTFEKEELRDAFQSFPGISEAKIIRWRNDIILQVQTRTISERLGERGYGALQAAQILSPYQIAHATIKLGIARAARELVEFYFNGTEQDPDWIRMRTSEQWKRFTERLMEREKPKLGAT